MIWFYIAGFISGIVGTLMLGRYMSRKVDQLDGEDEI